MFTKLDSSGEDRESSTTEMLTLKLPVTGGLIRLSYLDIINYHHCIYSYI